MLGRKIHQVFLTSVNQIAMPDIVPVPQKDFDTFVGPVRVKPMTVLIFYTLSILMSHFAVSRTGTKV